MTEDDRKIIEAAKALVAYWESRGPVDVGYQVKEMTALEEACKPVYRSLLSDADILRMNARALTANGFARRIVVTTIDALIRRLETEGREALAISELREIAKKERET